MSDEHENKITCVCGTEFVPQKMDEENLEYPMLFCDKCCNKIIGGLTELKTEFEFFFIKMKEFMETEEN